MSLHGLLERAPLSAGATVLASGEYEYVCNEQVVSVYEPWVVFEERGHRWVRSERIAAEGNVYIHVLAKLDEASHVLSFEVSWHEWDTKGLVVSAQYERAAGSAMRVVRQQYTLDGKSKSKPIGETVAMQDSVINHAPIIFPLLRIFMGGVISGLLAEGRKVRGNTLDGNEVEGYEAEVLIPSIVDAANIDQLLSPLMSTRRAIPLKRSTKCDVLCFDYVGDQYQAGSVFTFNRTGLLLEYRWQQGTEQTWQVRLINLEGRDDLLGFDLTRSPSSGECDETL